MEKIMCRAGGPRCPREARRRLDAALASRDVERIKLARDEWYETLPGNAELAEVDPAAARVHMLNREQLFGRLSDPDEAMNYLMDSDEYRGLISDRDAAVARHDELRGVDTSQMSDEEKRAHTDATREAFFAKLDAQQHLMEYQSRTLQEVNRVDYDYPEFTGDTLGEAVPHVRSPENVTIGGSEVSSVLKVDPKYGAANRREVLAYKIDPELRSHESTFATTKGDAWERVIVRDFADRHPEYAVMKSGEVWSNPNTPEDQAKVDALLCSNGDGVPNAILECKTASDPSKWRDEDGNVVVPDGYRAQVLSYLETTGFDHAYVAARIDDHEYVEARIDRGEKINEKLGTIADRQGDLAKFRDEVRKGRANGGPVTRSYNPHPEPQEKNNLESQVALFQGRDEDEVRQSVAAKVAAGQPYGDAVRSELREHPFKPEGMVVVDLETTGFTPSSGEVIEFAYQRLDAKGGVAEEGSMLCSPDPRFLRSRGTGVDEVHHISPDMVRGKPGFRSSRVQSQLAGKFPPGTVVVAHNAGFEQRFLSQDMQGGDQLRYLDTMTLSKYWTNAPTNELGSFTTTHGVPYEDAHRSLTDVDMTRRALWNFSETLTGGE